MESLALLVTVIVLARIAFVALCTALVIYTLHWRFVDGLLQTQPGLPPSPVYRASLMFAVVTCILVITQQLIR